MRTTATRTEVREAILDAAEALIGRYGYRKMTVDDVAQEARIGKGTVYLHFSSKEEVALSTIDRIVDRVLERLEGIAVSEGAPEARLREMLVARVMIRFDSVRHYSESIDELFRALRPAVLARRDRYFGTEARQFARVVEEGVRSGTFGPCEPLAAGELLVLATNSLLPSSLSTRELGERDDVLSRVEGLADLLLRGLLRRAERPA